ncbi:hypothetical protein [Spongorhabdus nitratireducens]
MSSNVYPGKKAILVAGENKLESVIASLSESEQPATVYFWGKQILESPLFVTDITLVGFAVPESYSYCREAPLFPTEACKWTPLLADSEKSCLEPATGNPAAYQLPPDAIMLPCITAAEGFSMQCLIAFEGDSSCQNVVLDNIRPGAAHLAIVSTDTTVFRGNVFITATTSAEEVSDISPAANRYSQSKNGLTNTNKKTATLRKPAPVSTSLVSLSVWSKTQLSPVPDSPFLRRPDHEPSKFPAFSDTSAPPVTMSVMDRRYSLPTSTATGSGSNIGHIEFEECLKRIATISERVRRRSVDIEGSEEHKRLMQKPEIARSVSLPAPTPGAGSVSPHSPGTHWTMSDWQRNRSPATRSGTTSPYSGSSSASPVQNGLNSRNYRQHYHQLYKASSTSAINTRGDDRLKYSGPTECPAPSVQDSRVLATGL